MQKAIDNSIRNSTANDEIARQEGRETTDDSENEDEDEDMSKLIRMMNGDIV
jgi:hypothetical protein